MSKFTRKHYEEIAKIIGNSNISFEDVKLLSTYFKADNPRFDSGRFMHAIAKHKVTEFERVVGNSVSRDQLQP